MQPHTHTENYAHDGEEGDVHTTTHATHTRTHTEKYAHMKGRRGTYAQPHTCTLTQKITHTCRGSGVRTLSHTRTPGRLRTAHEEEDASASKGAARDLHVSKDLNVDLG